MFHLSWTNQTFRGYVSSPDATSQSHGATTQVRLWKGHATSELSESRTHLQEAPGAPEDVRVEGDSRHESRLVRSRCATFRCEPQTGMHSNSLLCTYLYELAFGSFYNLITSIDSCICLFIP